MTYATLAEFLTAKAEASGFVGLRGQEELRTLLRERHGLALGTTTIYSWMKGDRAPRLRHLLLLLEALGVRGAEREQAIQLKAAVREDEAEVAA